jgi:hypothetical protein
MNTDMIALQLPAEVYSELQALAIEEHTDPANLIVQLVATASQQRAWRRNLAALRAQIRRDGGLQIGASKDEVVERLRQSRRQVFEAEYTHLY